MPLLGNINLDLNPRSELNLYSSAQAVHERDGLRARQVLDPHDALRHPSVCKRLRPTDARSRPHASDGEIQRSRSHTATLPGVNSVTSLASFQRSVSNTPSAGAKAS